MRHELAGSRKRWRLLEHLAASCGRQLHVTLFCCNTNFGNSFHFIALPGHAKAPAGVFFILNVLSTFDIDCQGVLERLAAAVGVPMGSSGGRSVGVDTGLRVSVAAAVVDSGRQRQLLQSAIGGIVRGSSRRQVRLRQGSARWFLKLLTETTGRGTWRAVIFIAEAVLLPGATPQAPRPLWSAKRCML